jgi:hypothetical protein
MRHCLFLKLLFKWEKNDVEYLVLFRISRQSIPGLLIIASATLFNFNNTPHITF